jgi:succinoglycan biosynthesis transport protein ExoP
MNEILKYFSLLKQYKLTLIVIPFITIIITFFLVRNLQDSYISTAQIATGIVDETRQSIISPALDREQAAQRFNNIIESMKMNRVLNQISYQLALHDLTSLKPYKKPSKAVLDLNRSARLHAINIFKDKYSKHEPLNISNADQKGLNEVLKSLGYDPESLKSKLLVYRTGDTDFIMVQFDSENPTLSAFVVNAVSAEFINQYSETVKENQIQAKEFLGNLLRAKTDTLNSRVQNLRNYKIINGIINLTDQSKQLYDLILEYDTKKIEAMEKTASYAGALDEIDRKLDPNERKYLEAEVSQINRSIVTIKDEMSAVYNLYLNNDFDEQYKKSYDSLSNVLSLKIRNSSDAYINNPLNMKQELITQKLALEIQLDISRYSLGILEKKIAELNGQLSQLVPKDADIQRLNMEIEIANKEYTDILNRYNQSSLEASISERMSIIQPGVPGLAQPSKKMLLVILSGIISFLFCLIVLFVIYFFDEKIFSAEELANKSGHQVLGSVNGLSVSSVDLVQLWEKEEHSSELLKFKNQLRALRNEVAEEVNGNMLILTSLNPGEGKTLLSLSLAFSWRMAKKKVLIIDGNFKHNSITEASSNTSFIEDFLMGQEDSLNVSTLNSIDILGNKGGDLSLFEIVEQDRMKAKLATLQSKYDLILIETSSLNHGSQLKEWLSFTNNIIVVFQAGGTFTSENRDQLSQLNVSSAFKGWILNKVRP